MKVIHESMIPEKPVFEEGAEGATIRWLIGKEDGAEHFAMRLFRLAPGGRTPLHTHGWEHEVYILEGEGRVWKEGEEVSVGPGYVIFVAPWEPHCFINGGNIPLRFLCLVPV